MSTLPRMTALIIDSEDGDTPKSVRETLCVAMTALGQLPYNQSTHRERLARLVAEVDRHRPLGPDGKHGNRHTSSCGCEDV